MFWGIARSLRKYTVTSIQNNLISRIKASCGDTVICVHTYTSKTVYCNEWAKEKPQMLDNTQHRLLKADVEIVEDQDEVWSRENLQALYPKQDPWKTDFKTYKNFILAVRSKATAYRALQRLQPRPDVVLYSRPDVVYNQPIQLSWISRCATCPKMILAPCWQVPWGINDRFAICGRQAAAYWSVIAFQYLKMRKCDTSEKQLFDCVTSQGAVLGTINFHFCRIRMDGHRCKADDKDCKNLSDSEVARRKYGVGDRLRLATATIRKRGTILELTR